MYNSVKLSRTTAERSDVYLFADKLSAPKVKNHIEKTAPEHFTVNATLLSSLTTGVHLLMLSPSSPPFSAVAALFKAFFKYRRRKTSHL